MNDGDAVGDVGQVVMRDRELLGESGVVLLYTNINPRTKKVITPLQVVCKGFGYIQEHPEFKETITEEFNKVADKYLSQSRIDWSEFKSDIRNSVSRLIYKQADASPIIIPVLISTDPSHLIKPTIDLNGSKKTVKKTDSKKETSKAVKPEKKVSKAEKKPISLEKNESKSKAVKKVVKKTTTTRKTKENTETKVKKTQTRKTVNKEESKA
jgi:hypothetical protein